MLKKHITRNILIKFYMLKKLLSEVLFNNINQNFKLEDVYEIRLRVNSSVVINYKGVLVLIKDNSNKNIKANKEDIERVVSVASNYSLYTVENQIKNAFITAEKGYRIGISGEIVTEDGNTLKSIKNIYSVNIRIPHKILNCSYSIFKFIYSNKEIKNTLIISPPGAGKTTYLRDICYQFSKLDNPTNILLLDERYEIAGVKDGKSTIDVGEYCDILSGANKSYGFEQGVRALKPDVIITDEIMTESDIGAVIKAINCGVKVIATIHADSIEMLKEKSELNPLLNARCIDRYIVLSNKNRVGECVGVYDKNLKCLYY